jgi:hypothetical protein
VEATSVDGQQLEHIAQAPSSRRRLTDWLEAQALFVCVVAVVAIVCMIAAASHLRQDGYLALVDGRVIALHGIPSHSYLTIMAHGVRWVDQQWLAQLGFYGLQRLGGYPLLVLVDIGLATLALAVAIFAARDLGGRERQMIRALPLGALFYIIIAVTIRSQVFAYPLFVVVLWLLASEARRPVPLRRTLLVFPILLLWANLHGSVTLGAGLVMLYGACRLVSNARQRGLRGLGDPRSIAFIVLAPLCLLANPYGFSIVHYYSATLFNSHFSHLVTEWQPIYAQPVLAVIFLALVALVAYFVVRSGRRTPLFDWVALTVLAVGGILALRNMIWFGLASIILLPAAMDQLGRYREPMPKRRRLNLTLSISMLALTAITILATAAHPASWFQRTYDQRGIAKVNAILAQHPSARIFSDVHFGDWLLWQDPKLAGRVAYDTSFELMPVRDLQAFTAFYRGRTAGYAQVLNPYSVLVLDPMNKKESSALLRLPGTHVVLRTKKIIVATKPAT